jgi:hypothetical protein
MLVTMKVTVFWDVIPCSLVDVTNVLEEHLQGNRVSQTWKK